ncbi:MAG: helix-turn-helix domain-containing protein [Candidatus Levyibacteriota bacterium]
MRNLSDILKQERERKNLTVEDVVKATKIRQEFIRAIEQGNFDRLPSESYALGFVKNYAQFLGISSLRAAALFRREFEEKRIDVVPRFKKSAPIKKRKIWFSSPKTYLISLLALIVLSYVVFQFSFLFMGPKLNILAPLENSHFTSNIIEVNGTTDPYATVSINNEEVYVDLSGSFRKTLYIYSGDAKIVVSAKNRYGKETRKIIDVSVQ